MAKKFKSLTKVHKAQLEKLYDAKSAAMNAIYEFNLSNVPFNRCYEYANQTRKLNFDLARKAIIDFEHAMVLQGRGWLDGGGYFHSY